MPPTVKVVNFYQAELALSLFIQKLEAQKTARLRLLDSAGPYNRKLADYAFAAYTGLRAAWRRHEISRRYKPVFLQFQDCDVIAFYGDMDSATRRYITKYRLQTLEIKFEGFSLIVFKFLEVEWPDLAPLVIARAWLNSIRRQARPHLGIGKTDISVNLHASLARRLNL